MNEHFRFGATMLALAVTFAVTKVNEGRPPRPLALPLSNIASDIEGWVGIDDPPPPEQILKSLNATAFLSRTYRRGGDSMNVWVAYYARQQAGETMHSPKHCVPGSGWEFIAQDAVRLKGSGGGADVNEYVLIRPGERMRMLYWYQSRQRIVSSEYIGKLALMWDAIRYGQTSGSLVRVTLPDRAGSRDDSLAFAAEVMSQVRRCFGE